jgi:hypothetical protein
MGGDRGTRNSLPGRASERESRVDSASGQGGDKRNLNLPATFDIGDSHKV